MNGRIYQINQTSNVDIPQNTAKIDSAGKKNFEKALPESVYTFSKKIEGSNKQKNLKRIQQTQSHQSKSLRTFLPLISGFSILIIYLRILPPSSQFYQNTFQNQHSFSLIHFNFLKIFQH